ncbi:MAG: two component AraC family transcriptional regulator [Herbinix sp.]|jgi:YesN/AraC family two-component response regulator|nr:two component AraC family transcriptional regulator [Herbinix sp.]
MYRVMLVDDEPWTLKGIQETFRWDNYGLMVVGAYESATLALQEILEKKPDVVFTDIRMPILNGMELLNEIRKHELDTEVIIISGFGQFDYAQEAIRQGAFDYVLKPVDEDETDSLLERLKKKLDQKLEEKNKRIIEMIIDAPNEIKPEQYGLHSKFSHYQVIVMNGIVESGIKDLLNDSPNLEYVDITMSNKVYYIINCENDLFDTIKGQGFSMTLGISKLSNSIEEIPDLITQASIAANSLFITNKIDTYSYQETQSQKLIPFIIRITKILNEGQLVDFTQLIDEIPQMFLEKNYSVEDLCYLWNRIIMHIELIAPSKFQNSMLDLCEWQQLESKYESIAAMCHTLMDEAQYIFGHTEFEMEDDELRSSNFKKILKYMNKNFNQQIKLKDLSQMFYVNKNYACFLFKRYTGMTYSEYLNKIRMEHAKKLLVTTSYTIAEVSEKAGYVDYFYFCKLFKKTYGATPTQYRQKPIEMVD